MRTERTVRRGARRADGAPLGQEGDEGSSADRIASNPPGGQLGAGLGYHWVAAARDTGPRSSWKARAHGGDASSIAHEHARHMPPRIAVHRVSARHCCRSGLHRSMPCACGARVGALGAAS